MSENGVNREGGQESPPLGILLGIIAAAKKQTVLGVIGIIIAVISLLMSPSFQLLLIGMGMH